VVGGALRPGWGGQWRIRVGMAAQRDLLEEQRKQECHGQRQIRQP
jgi:hypothetical protein